MTSNAPTSSAPGASTAELSPGALPFSELAGRQIAPRADLFSDLQKELLQGAQTEGSAGASKIRLPRSRIGRLMLSAAMLFLGLVCTSLGALERDGRTLLVLGAVSSLLLGGLLLGSLAPGPGARPRLEVRRMVVAALSMAALTVVGIEADHFLSGSEVFIKAQLTGATACATHGLFTGLLCGGGLMFLWRGTDPFTPRLTGALVGSMGGITGLLSVGVACPSIEGLHLLFGHAAVVLSLSLLGAAMGRRWLAP